jgi:predicted permease
MAANAAFFAAVDTLLLQPLPYASPDRLVALVETQPGTRARTPVSPPNFISWRSASRSLADIAAYRTWGFVLAGPGGGERIAGARVSANLLPLLGVRLAVGRAFLAEEDVFGSAHVAIVSHAFWQQRLGAPLDLTGHALALNGAVYTIVGVLPPDFRMPAADVLVPLSLEPFAFAQRGNRSLTIVGRLGDGASLSVARSEMDAIARDLGARFPDADAGWGINAIPLNDEVSARFRPALLMLWASIALVLLIACANTAGLMLSRVAARRQQLAVCRALGAGRARIVADLLAESGFLAAAAGLLSLPLARVVLAALVAIVPPDLSRFADVGIDLRATGFCILVAAAAAVLIGLPAALRGSRDDLSPLLRTGRWDLWGDAVLRRAALAGQLALALLVVLGSGLLLRSLDRVLAVDPGFETAHVLTMAVAPDAKYADTARRLAFFDEVIARVDGLPGVETAGISSHPPLASAPLLVDVFNGAISRAPAARPADAIASLVAVGGNWFAAMRVPLRDGRWFGSEDGPGSRPVVVVSENLAHRLWPSESAVGKRIVVGGSVGADQAAREVIGTVGNVRIALETAPPFHVYVPYAQNAWPTMTLAIRTSGDPARMAPAIRDAVHGIDREQATYNMAPLDRLAARAVAPRRFQAIVVSLFALFAVLLAAMGSHAVIAYAVRQRTMEFGVRLALGASRRSVVLLALQEVLRPAAAGMTAGACLALLASRWLRSLLFSVCPTDAPTIAASLGLIVAVVTLASLGTGLRVARLDAARALRDG